MTPLLVRARLLNGYVTRDRWSPTLCGILAAAAMRERLGPEEFVISAAAPRLLAPVEGLPLEVLRHGEDWWYAASSPQPLGSVGQQRRHYHRRFDDQHERHLAGDVRRVMTAAGPYKTTRLADTRTICRGIAWHAIGDATEVRRLLRGIHQVGARRDVGYGEVTEWLVEEGGDAAAARHRRPLPVAYAEAIGIDGMRMPWSLVPPARCVLRECVMP